MQRHTHSHIPGHRFSGAVQVVQPGERRLARRPVIHDIRQRSLLVLTHLR
jgi:hypothetical protein